MSPSKILVCGDVRGNFSQLFSKVESVCKKSGPFDMLLCVGDFFGPTNFDFADYKKERKKVPLPVYILGPNRAEDVIMYPDLDGGDVAYNITHLGKKGLLNCSTGLTLAYMSGVESPGPHGFTRDDVYSLEKMISGGDQITGVDILLTSPCPQDVGMFGGKPEGELTASSLVSHLATHLKPRYHFSSGGNTFYERLPYRNHVVLNEPSRHVTRFIALASVGNAAKKKWLYAFTINPMKEMDHKQLVHQPPDVTEIPYTNTMKNLLEAQQAESEGQQFFYDMDSGPVNNKRKNKGGGGGANKQHKPAGPCWFCLASPEVEKHLVISVGEEVYLALAKGGLVPDHLLILPIGHAQSSVELGEDVAEEINKFKSALRKYFASQGKCVVFFERNYKSQHMQLQVVPLPQNNKDYVTQVFMDMGDGAGIEFDDLQSDVELVDVAEPGTPYFYVETPDAHRLFYSIRKHFPIQFGREVLCSDSLLDLPAAVDWRDCKISKDEEVDLVKTFTKSFNPFDFTQ